MKKIIFLLFLFLNQLLSAQVGIGTTNPKAKLDIAITDPTNPNPNDGILVPRVNIFPSQDPIADQDGMLIFLNQDILDSESVLLFSRGFYFWDNSSSNWKPLIHIRNKDFYVFDTAESPTNIEDDVFRKGKMSIGQIEDDGKLSVIVTDVDEDLTNKPHTALHIENNHPSEGASYESYGVDVRNNSLVSGETYGINIKNSTINASEKYGLSTYVTGAGTGINYGIHTEVSENHNSGGAYGIKSLVNTTYGATNMHYGIYTEIGSSDSAGFIYGIYSKADGNNDTKVFAGYFEGRVAIGPNPYSETEADHYVLPLERGNEGEVMTATADGSVMWESRSSYAFITVVNNANANFEVTENMHTIRITDVGLTHVNLPDPTITEGKVYILINTLENSLTLSTADESNIIDDTAVGPITSLGANSRLRIQSDAENWIVIGN